MMNDDSSLRAAVIGCGRIGVRTPPTTRAGVPPGWLPLNHAEAARAAGFRLVALCEVDGARLAQAGAELGVTALYRDYHELLQKEAPDVVGIATRTLGRTDILRAAVEAGVRGIHIEKPISRSLADARHALLAARQRGVHLTYGTTRRYMEAYRLAREWVCAGEIGDLVEISVAHGVGPLLWTHPHSTDLLVFFSGCPDVEYVQASCRITQPVVGGVLDEDPIIQHAAVRFANGVQGLIQSSAGCHTTLSGTRGMVTVACDGQWLEMRRPSGSYQAWPERTDMTPTASGTQGAFAALSAAIRGGGPVTAITPDDIELSHALLFAIVTSSLQDGRRIRLQDVDPNLTITGKSGEFYA